VADRQCGKLFAPGVEKHAGADHEPACPYSDYCCEDCIEVALGAGCEEVKLQPETAGRGLQILCRRVGAGWIVAVEEDRDESRRRD
jgi:hypothetical protein